jgi:hypothetical protein
MAHANPGLRPGLSSAVPTGLNFMIVGSNADTKALIQENSLRTVEAVPFASVHHQPALGRKTNRNRISPPNHCT